jgi:DNA repair exonuclease SbcCD ATPase subunit
MKIRHIEIQNFRRFRDPVIVSGIGDGLTVLAGENEAGKSTLLRALQAALFDRHSIGKSVAKTFLPFQSEVQPQVTIEFECGGASYRLRKGFYLKPFAELQVTSGSAVYSDAEAEEKLQDLLRFKSPERGRADEASQHGILGLLWLEQGASSERWRAALADKEGPAGRSLHTALEGELGEVLGGPYGHQLLSRIAERHGEFFGKNGRPRGAFAQAQKTIAELSEELAQVAHELGRTQTASDELLQARQALSGLQRQGLLARAQLALQQAEEAWQRVRSAESAGREAEEHRKAAEVQVRLAAQSYKQRQSEQAWVDGERRRLAEKNAQLAQGQARLGELTSAQAAAEERFEKEQGRAQQLTAELRRFEASETRLRLSREKRRLSQSVEQAQAAERQGTSLMKQVRSLLVDDAALRKLQGLRADLRVAEGRVDAVATRVDAALHAGLVLRQDGQPIEPSRPLLLTQKTELALWQGEHLLGTLTIHPGAEDLTLRNQRVAELRGALNAALQAVGVADFDAAEAQAHERSAILQQVQTLREQYKASAPRGIEALQAELQRVDAQLQQLSGVEESGEAVHEDGGEEETLASQLAELCAERRRSLQQVQSAISQAQAQVRSAQLACQEHTNRLALLQGEVQSGSEALQAKEAALVEAQSRTADADLQQALRGAQERLEVAEARALSAQADLAKAEPLKVEEELRARGSEVGKLRAEIDRLTQQVARLEGELGGLAQQDLREREERLQAQLQREQTVAAQQSQQAEALRLLHEVLLDAERRAREDFMLPVERRVEHYLQKLWPGSKPQFSSADFALSELQRGGISEPFNALSIGTREQLAVISRLAVADLLHKQGQPTCLLFDDILVFADDRRFQIMLAALKDAAQTQQILILTCRGRDYANQDLLVRLFPEGVVRHAA